MDALVSVVIPTYYREAPLIAAVESVYDQTHESIELIVVDDSGEAYAEGITDRFRGHRSFEYIAHESNRGAHAARQTGLERVSGDYIQFFDDDDVMLPTKFERQLQVFDQSTGVGVVYSGLKYDDGTVHSPDPGVRGDVLSECLSFYEHPLTTSTMLIDSSVLAELTPLDTTVSGAQDIYLAIKLAQRTQFDFADECLVIAGRSEDSLGASWAGVEARWEIIETFADLYEEQPADVRNEALAETYQLEGRRHLEDNFWSLRAILAFARVLRYDPEVRPSQVAEFCASLAGRPGRQLAGSLRSLL